MKKLINSLAFLSTIIVSPLIMFNSLAFRNSYSYIFALNILSFFIVIPLFLLYVFGIYKLFKPYYIYGKKTDNNLVMLSSLLIGIVEILSVFILILQDFGLSTDLGVLFWYSLSLPVLAGFAGFGFAFDREVKLKNLKSFSFWDVTTLGSDVLVSAFWRTFGFLLYIIAFVLTFIPILIPFISAIMNVLFRMCALKNSDKIY